MSINQKRSLDQTAKTSLDPLDIKKVPGSRRRRTAAEEMQTEGFNSFIVVFEGPDDPVNPLNWSRARKWSLCALISAMTLVVLVNSSDS